MGFITGSPTLEISKSCSTLLGCRFQTIKLSAVLMLLNWGVTRKFDVFRSFRYLQLILNERHAIIQILLTERGGAILLFICPARALSFRHIRSARRYAKRSGWKSKVFESVSLCFGFLPVSVSFLFSFSL